MSMPNIPGNTNDRVVKQHKGIIHLAFGVNSTTEVDQKAIQLKEAGLTILSGQRKTGDGYYEFETLDPDNNQLEVTCIYPGKQFASLVVQLSQSHLNKLYDFLKLVMEAVRLIKQGIKKGPLQAVRIEKYIKNICKSNKRLRPLILK